MALVYRPNPRHKHPWQPGARGSLCPREADGDALLQQSVPHPAKPGKRYATDGDQAYCAHPSNQQTADGDEIWHGFPEDWKQVPAAVQRMWVDEGLISRPRYR